MLTLRLSVGLVPLGCPGVGRAQGSRSVNANQGASALAVDGAGNPYVADSGSHRVLEDFPTSITGAHP
jgi:hypothetical protein